MINVDPITQDCIKTKLFDIEREHGVRIIAAVESGSRAWGFESKDSDYDVRFIYLRPLSWYVSVFARRDVIEPPTEGLLDFVGWDLQKALGLMGKNNPQLLEWLNSTFFYREHPILSEEMRRMGRRYFSAQACIYHYLHMANGNYRAYLKKVDNVPLKKYFYVIRPLLACAFIERFDQMAPVSWKELVKLVELPTLMTGAQQWAITNLYNAKVAGQELDEAPPIQCLNTWIEQRLNHFSEIARTTPRGDVSGDALNEFLFWAVRNQ